MTTVDAPMASAGDLAIQAGFGVRPPTFDSVEGERQHRKEMLVAGFHIIAMMEMEEGFAGHVTARDPEHPDRFWVNPFGKYFGLLTVDDLLLVDHDGTVLEGEGIINPAGYAIHTAVHQARPDAVGCAHAHAPHGMALSALGVGLLPLTQTSTAFFEDHAVLDHYPEDDMGGNIARALGPNKAVILAHHGCLTVGATVESTIWWFVSMERQARVQLLAMAAGDPRYLPDHVARKVGAGAGSETAGWMSFGALHQRLEAQRA